MTNAENKQPKPYPLRMATDIKRWLEDRAKRSNRSLNAEMVTIFQELRAKEESEKTQAS